jgi:hypothetical protein
MGADISRARFEALKDFAGVQLQQGRVLLDADFNELVDVLDRRLRASAADLGSPGPQAGESDVAVVPRTTPDGFAVTAAGGTISIGVGRMYVDGIVVENHGAGPTDRFDPLLAETVFTAPTPYTAQPYWSTPDPLPAAGSYLAYLDVWQREVTPLLDPDLIEQAIGVDTTTRVQNVWQVRLLDPAGAGVGGGVTCSTPDADIPGWAELIAPSAARLTTTTVPVDPSLDPCVLPPTGGYRGLENQLYRVQVHKPGPLGTATFVWSRDSASVSTAVSAVLSPTELAVASLGRDSVLRISTGDWVEITDDHREFAQTRGEIRKVTVDDAAATLTFSPPLPAELIPSGAGSDTAAARHLRVIRWDQSGKVFEPDGTTLVVDLDGAGSDGTIPIPATPNTETVLENGIAVSFSAASATGVFRAGDYWVFAARTADTSIEILTAAPPRGIHHHYARLAIVTLPGGQTDCRTPWPPEGGGGDDGCACTVCVTPESHASGSLTIQHAVDMVTPTGGTVCLGAGLYPLDAAVRVTNATSVRLHGQGIRSVLVAQQGAFALDTCIDCTIEELGIVAGGTPPAITVNATAAVTLQRLAILALGSTRQSPADPAVEAPAAPPPPATNGIAVTVSGLNALLTVRENVIAAAAGLINLAEATIFRPAAAAQPPAADEQQQNGDLLIDLRVGDNMWLCSQYAVLLRGQVNFAYGALFCRNDIWGGQRAGIVATGAMLAEGTLRITDNDLFVAGAGILAASGNTCISGNDITSSVPAHDTSNQDLFGIGIASTLSSGDAAVIDGNTITAMSDPGVSVESKTLQTLRITGNRVSGCVGGIDVHVSAGDVTITGNELIDLVLPTVAVDGVGIHPQGLDFEDLVAIQVIGADLSTIADNTIDGIDRTGSPALGRVGIRTQGCPEMQISRNQIRRAISTGGQPQLAFGIDIGGPVQSAIITHNHVMPGDSDTPGPATGTQWMALNISGAATAFLKNAGSSGLTTADMTLIVPMSDQTTLVSIGGQARVLSVGKVPSNVGIDGNYFAGGQLEPGVLVRGIRDVRFCANHVDHTEGGDDTAPAVQVNAESDFTTAIVQGNRVRGGTTKNPSLQIEVQTVTVLGNITSAGVSILGPLGVWAPLNVLSAI